MDNSIVFEVLQPGSANAQTAKELCQILNMTARDLTRQIERERKSGKPICASCGDNPGYYIAEDQETMRAYCSRLEHRENQIAETRSACFDCIEDLPRREMRAANE